MTPKPGDRAAWDAWVIVCLMVAVTVLLLACAKHMSQ